MKVNEKEESRKQNINDEKHLEIEQKKFKGNAKLSQEVKWEGAALAINRQP